MRSSPLASDPGPIWRRARAHDGRIALIAGDEAWSYDRLHTASAGVATDLLAGRTALDGARVAFLVPPGPRYVACQWGIWRAGGVAVPLAVSHPEAELAYVLDDAEPERVVVDPALAGRLGDAARVRSIPTVELSVLLAGSEAGGAGSEAAATGARAVDAPAPAPPDRAMMIYTSGTTGRPKGVVTTHGALEAQIRALVDAWGWRPDDRILHVLPLHHVHGVVNALACALWTGAACEFLRFDPEAVWDRLGSGEITVFMAVPTIYARLVQAWDEADSDRRTAWSEGARTLRLMVSGSAALPVPTLERWRDLTGHTLLERYGMTEIGMALSNPLDGERRPGTVGQPLPRVETRIVGPSGDPVAPGTAGELEVRGPQVFGEYWRRPEATREAFRDGWFRTGDEVVLEDGYFRILGRRSVDILKTGGYKVSALEIEAVFRGRADVRDLAVVGVDDPVWGERVCAAVVPRGPAPDPAELEGWARERLAPYKVPREFRMVDALPRNAMGKVTKPDVQRMFESRPPDEDRTHP